MIDLEKNWAAVKPIRDYRSGREHDWEEIEHSEQPLYFTNQGRGKACYSNYKCTRCRVESYTPHRSPCASL